ncbi:MAG: hypothetical protein ACO1NZ_04605 [Adhaeribacter sp.]
MRQIAEIPNPEMKITVFSWNGKYLIKLEKGPLEQTFKVDEMDVAGEAEVRQLLDETFLERTLNRFKEMGQDLQQAQQRVEG